MNRTFGDQRIPYPVGVTVEFNISGHTASASGLCHDYRDIDLLVGSANDTLVRKLNTPEFQEYDVVSVEFPRKDGTTNGQKYTYMRTDGYWPGQSGESWADKSDEEITELWLTGHAVLLVRDGERWDQAARP